MKKSNGLSIQVARGYAADLGLIAVIWCAAVLIVNPIGNFPLLDDWYFGRTVNNLITTGDYRPLGGELMTMISNILWGYLFCLPDGFSYTALRFSTLSMSLVGLSGVYVLVRDLQQPRSFALLITLTLGLNPVYFVLAHTFMTDVPFVAFSVWSTVFLCRSLRSGSFRQMLIGSAFALAATLSRQLGLCITLAFAAAVFAKPGVSWRAVGRAVFPLLICVVAFLGFKHWLAVSGRTAAMDFPIASAIRTFTHVKLFARFAFGHALLSLQYLGLFLFPLLLICILGPVGNKNKLSTTHIAVGVVIVVVGCAVRAYLGDTIALPIYDNVLVRSGVGPVMVRDTFFLHLDNMTPLPSMFWFVVTAMSLIGAVLLIAALCAQLPCLVASAFRRRPVRDVEYVGFFFILCGAMYLAILIPFQGFFDRYVILLIPFFAVGILSISGGVVCNAPIRPPVSGYLRINTFALLLAATLFSVAGTRDYLEWNRVRWAALRGLTQSDHVSAEEIDGGYEFNGNYLYDLNYSGDEDRSWWFVNRDTYQIGFGPVPGYRVIKEFSYYRWLIPHVQKVVVLKKD